MSGLKKPGEVGLSAGVEGAGATKGAAVITRRMGEPYVSFAPCMVVFREWGADLGLERQGGDS